MRHIFFLFAVIAGGSTSASNPAMEDCSDKYGESARCVQVDVPEDRDAPEGRQIRLNVVVLPSRSEGDREPLLLFPGGPGQATPTLIPVATQLYPGVQGSRDIVFVGQRGSGESNPMNCLQDIGSDPTLMFGALWHREKIRQCWQNTQSHASPQHYTTADYVADVIDVLDRLGYRKVVLWGGSGGTRIAQAFIREAPGRVIAAALDGVTPISYAMPLPFAQFAQRAWDRVVADCQAQPDCAESYPDLNGDLETLFKAVESAPVPTKLTLTDGSSATVNLSRGDLAYSLRGNLYNPNAISKLPANVHQAATSDDLSFFAQSLYNRSVGLLTGGVIAVGLHITHYCAEDVPRIDDSLVDANTRGTFLDRYVVDEYRGACEQWPVMPVPTDWYRSWQSQTPTLMVSGYYDPSTPAESAEQVRTHLPNSRHIVVRNVSHGAGFTCARKTVEQFLLSASLDHIENPCPDEPIQFEISASQ